MAYSSKLGRPLPSQGYSGKDVEHKNLDTYTSDWRREFGPKSGHKSYHEICAQYKDNQWCRLHGYYDQERPHRSGSDLKAPASFLLILALTSAALERLA